MRIMGRKFLYQQLIADLLSDQLYSSGSIAAALDGPARNRARRSLNQMKKLKQFPEPEGLIELPGQGYQPAWYGRTWQALVLEDDAQMELPLGDYSREKPD